MPYFISDSFLHCLSLEQGILFLWGVFVDLLLKQTYLYDGGLINY